MSEEKKEVSWGYAYVLSESSPEKIIGRIMTLVEVIGLSETQEKSAKSLVRQVVREVFDESIYIKPERYAEIKNAYFVERALPEKNQVPMSAI